MTIFDKKMTPLKEKDKNNKFEGKNYIFTQPKKLGLQNMTKLQQSPKHSFQHDFANYPEKDKGLLHLVQAERCNHFKNESTTYCLRKKSEGNVTQILMLLFNAK